MPKDDKYFSYQTPPDIAEKLIKYVDIADDDILFEPFRGEGAFYNNLPSANTKHWCEITEGRDYKDHKSNVDWVITNPPFRIDGKNAHWDLLYHFTTIANKGIAFLINDRCLSSITPRRLSLMIERGFYINKVILCSIPKWRGRYYFIIFQKSKSGLFIPLA